MEGKAVIPIKEYDKLLEIKLKYFKLLEVCSSKVDSHRDVLQKYVEEKMSYMLDGTILRIEEICDATGWSCADVDAANVQMAKEKLARIIAREAEVDEGYQE